MAPAARKRFRSARGALPTLTQAARGDIRVAPLLMALARTSADEALVRLSSSSAGLSSADAVRRLAEHGANEMLDTGP